MAEFTYLERRAGVIIYVTGLLMGAALVLAVLGFFWWPFSFVCLVIGLGVFVLSSRNRALDFDRWLKGASGESQVRNALKELESLDFVVLDDIDIGRGNIDHIVVGPAGVFAIETKNRGGRVFSKEGRLFLNSWPVEDHRQAVRSAMWVRSHSAGHYYVDALLVYPSAAVDGDVIRFPNVTILGLSRLNGEITSKGHRLEATDIESIVQQLRSAASSVLSPR